MAAVPTKSEDILASGLNLLIMPVVLLSGVMLPLTIGPGWLRWLGHASTFYYVINAMRAAYQGSYGGTVMVEGFAVAVVMATTCVWAATAIFLREDAR